MVEGAAIAARKPLVKIKDETEYYQHQIEGIRELRKRTSFILADEMGLGKSLQALTVAAIDYQFTQGLRTLIVSPASLKWNWAAEIEEFTHFTYKILDAKTPTKRDAQMWEYAVSHADILICHYEQIVEQADHLNQIGFHFVIADEAHYMKGPESQRTIAMQLLKARRFALLTGSPILNQVDDLWSLIYRINPTLFPHYYKFRARYCVFGGYKDKQVVGTKNEAELKARIDPLILRREKKDVLDLPDKLYIPILVDMSPAQRRIYDKARKELLLEMPDPEAPPKEIKNALSKALRLKQICSTPATIEGHKDDSPKLDLAVERALEIMANGEHVVIFTQFRAVLECVRDRIFKATKRTDNLWVLHGDIPMERRKGQVDRWSDGPPGAMIAMLQVAGVGLNMTKASKCIFVDKLWVPKLNEQAEDRLHRIGADKTKPIEIISIQCRDSIEARVEQILKRKTKVFNTVMADDTLNKKIMAALYEEEYG